MTIGAAAVQRRKARRLFVEGKVGAALELQRDLVAGTAQEPERDDWALLAKLYDLAGESEQAAGILQSGLDLWPEDIDFLKNVGSCLLKAGRLHEAEPWFLRSVRRAPRDARNHDALNYLYFRLGDEEKARHHGAAALRIKDAEAEARGSAHDLTGIPIPAFDPADTSRNVIAFSLWGARERYVQGALENARLAPHLYPEWSCRFYCDETVPGWVRAELMATGANIILMPGASRLHEGLFWRFRVAFDDRIDRFLVRDADSVFSLRERMAVDAWIRSDKHFHILRDFVTHTDPVLAGLWGGVRGALPDLTSQIDRYVDDVNKTRASDQVFLREQVWPTARLSACVHDSVFRVPGASRFPAHARRRAGRHIGQDASSIPHLPLGGCGVLTPEKARLVRRAHYIFTVTAGRTGTTFLTDLLEANLNDAEVHHERTGYQNFGRLTPDASHFTLFNSRGNTREVRDFWRRKFAHDRFGAQGTYVETSHYLAKAGLMENLDLLGPEAHIDIVLLKRDIFDTVWSFANRFDFANPGFTWLFALDPNYPRHIIDPAPLRRHGMFGCAFWYVAEMRARGAYYKLLFGGRPNVRFHEADLEHIVSASGAAALLRGLRRMDKQTEPVLPGKANATKAWVLGATEKKFVRRLVEANRFDPTELAKEFLRQGQRLA